MSLQSVGLFVIVTVCYDASFFVVAHCIFLIAFGADLESEIRILNETIRFESENKKKIPMNRQIEIKKQLCKLIQSHCNAKQLSESIHAIPIQFL